MALSFLEIDTAGLDATFVEADFELSAFTKKDLILSSLNEMRIGY